MKISYTDGAEVESRIVRLLAENKDLSSSSLLASEHYDDWAVRYHLSPERSNLFRHFDFEGLDVLELGAGMGGASRFPAETARSFTAVEGTEARMRGLKQRLRDLKNWQGVVAGIDDYKTEKRFDLVCIIGVLEYAELYMPVEDGESPFVALLRKATSLLKPGGQVVLAIENSHGFKYWAGAPEDHTGQLYDGICGYPEVSSPRTFSRSRLLKMLGEVGLHQVEEFYPWPDYKTPHAVISKRFVDKYPTIAADIAVDAMSRELEDGATVFPLQLAVPSAVSSGLLPDLANSFLFVAGKEPHSYTQAKLLRRMFKDQEFAWHYSIRRRRPIRTVFRFDPMYRRAPYVEKQALFDDTKDSESDYVTWRHQEPTPALLEPKASHYLRSAAYFQGRKAFEDAFAHYLKWAFKRWRFEEGYLRPAAFDAVPQNAVITTEGYQLFDLEWELASPMNQSWLILRSVYTLRDALGMLSPEEATTPAELYETMCRAFGLKPQLEDDLRREAKVQADVFRRISADESYEMMHRALHAHGPTFPRSPQEQAALRHHAGKEQAQIILELQAANQKLERKAVKLALSVDDRLKRYRGLYSVLAKGMRLGQRLRRRK